jgi:hypothetical protein
MAAVGDDAPPLQKYPAWQPGVAAAMPYEGQWLAGGQLRHAAALALPLYGLYVPGAHGVGDDEPAGQ